MRKNARKFEIYRNPCNAKFTKASHWIRYSELLVVRVYRAIFCVIFADFQFTLLAIRNCKPLEWFTMGASNGLDKTLSRKLDIHSMLRYAARWSIRDILFISHTASRPIVHMITCLLGYTFTKSIIKRYIDTCLHQKYIHNIWCLYRYFCSQMEYDQQAVFLFICAIIWIDLCLMEIHDRRARLDQFCYFAFSQTQWNTKRMHMILPRLRSMLTAGLIRKCEPTHGYLDIISRLIKQGWFQLYDEVVVLCNTNNWIFHCKCNIIPTPNNMTEVI